jgi:hypothetical protein
MIAVIANLHETSQVIQPAARPTTRNVRAKSGVKKGHPASGAAPMSLATAV